MIDLDWITVRIAACLPARARSLIDGGTDSYRNGLHVRWKGQLSPDAVVVAYPEWTVVSGSPHKHLRGESVGRFGPTEIRAYAAELSDRLHIPRGVVLAGRVSRFDLGANLILQHDAAEYIRLTSPPARMYEVGSGPGSTAFKNGYVSILFYDKAAKVRGRRLGHTLPSNWDGGHVLRVEVRFRKAAREFKRPLALGDLCTDEFWEVATERWLSRVLSVPLNPLTYTVPFALTKSALRDRYAELGVQVSGGRDAALLRVNRAYRAGLMTSAQAKPLRRWVVNVDIGFDDVDLVGPAAVPLIAELDQAIRAAVLY
ncbi:MAG TPA: hypothetical protein VGB53_10260 [Rubricoccaceae bacterium]|jgi:hypothetical protein